MLCKYLDRFRIQQKFIVLKLINNLAAFKFMNIITKKKKKTIIKIRKGSDFTTLIKINKQQIFLPVIFLEKLFIEKLKG